MAVVPNPKEERKELWKLVCKGCNGEIDDMGCASSCKYDTMNFSDRDLKTLEYQVYTLTRTEPYRAKKK
jgi:hypothetical protein